mmetsp:Transcript_7623/g.30177  ORF Transcript_7623/g.30177 Transcript_7623/m.30177 type:complete len:222 (-) Transcript_7623:433-1098(-)
MSLPPWRVPWALCQHWPTTCSCPRRTRAARAAPPRRLSSPPCGPSRRPLSYAQRPTRRETGHPRPPESWRLAWRRWCRRSTRRRCGPRSSLSGCRRGRRGPLPARLASATPPRAGPTPLHAGQGTSLPWPRAPAPRPGGATQPPAGSAAAHGRPEGPSCGWWARSVSRTATRLPLPKARRVAGSGRSLPGCCCCGPAAAACARPSAARWRTTLSHPRPARQ